MRKKTIILLPAILMLSAASGQTANDTVIVSLGNTSKVIFTIGDRSDLQTLKQYDFQKLFQDILARIERDPATRADSDEADAAGKNEEPRSDSEDNARNEDDDRDENDRDPEWRRDHRHRRGGIGRTWQTSNLDLGISNYLTAAGQFPDAGASHSVRPWGSWYVGINSLQRTKAGRNFFIEWALGVSWYNFKFQSDLIAVSRGAEEVMFDPLTANPEFDYIKSKLRVTYLNASLVPVLDFGDRGRKPRVWDSYGSEFRIGIGPYAGYRIGSKSKIVYEDEHGDRKKEKMRDSFYLNDLRYGVRLQLGFRSTDLFFNYDFNELFREGRGPELNAMSFGLIF